MMSPDTIMIMIMVFMLTANLMTNKTSIMCLNLLMYVLMMCTTLSTKMKLTPIPFIIFLTMAGGLMIIFLYFAASSWMKKETITLKTKTILIPLLASPIITQKKFLQSMDMNNSIDMFSNNLNKFTMMIIILLTLLLVFTIEIHMKTNHFFRRKLKIWG